MIWFLVCLAAGWLSACGFAPLDLWPLTLVAVAVLLYAIETAPTLRSALIRGWGFGLGQFTLGLNWIATAFTYQANMPAWLGWVAVVALSLYLAVYPAVATGLAWQWGRSDRLRLVLVFAAAWLVTEWLRGTMFTGFPWNPLGAALLPTPAPMLATWIGTYGLGAVTVLLAGAVYLLSLRWWRSFLGLAAAVGITTALAFALAPTLATRPGPTVRIIQPNIGQQVKYDPSFHEPNRRRVEETTGLPSGEPRLVFWPEVAVPDFLGIDTASRIRFSRVLGPRDVLVTGAVELVFGADGFAQAAYNSVFVMDAFGRVRGRYDKAHLVPYGEYLPMRPLLSALGLSELAPGDVDTLEGPGPRTLALPGFGTVGLQVCYEIVFSGQVVDRANRPQFLFNPSNDAWFGRWGPPQHFAQARLRAVEEGLPVLRSTPTGISGVIDARGRVVAAIPWLQQGVIDQRLPPAAPPTLFARLGNLASFLFAALLVFAAAASARLQSRVKRDREPRT